VASAAPLLQTVIRADLAGDVNFRARFRQEVSAARKVNGLFTALVVDVDPDGAMPWLATAYVPDHAEHERGLHRLAPGRSCSTGGSELVATASLARSCAGLTAFGKPSGGDLAGTPAGHKPTLPYITVA
jgi:hypothetical protein